MRVFAICLLLVINAVHLVAADQVRVADWFVSPAGDDRWSGTLPDRSADGTDGPLASVEAALGKERQSHAQAGSSRSLVICLRAGVYQLAAPIIMTAQDSATCLRAYPGEKPILSAGIRITSWVQGEQGVWHAPCPAQVLASGYPFEFFVDGRRCARTRLPAKGLYQVDQLPPTTASSAPGYALPSAFIFHAGEWQAAWHDLSDVECIFTHFWIDAHLHPASVDEANRRVTFLQHAPHPLTDDYTGKPGWYWIENVAEALHDPGQWYLDRSQAQIRYLPRPGEDMTQLDAELPLLPCVLSIFADPSSPARVTDVQLQGLELRYAEQHLGAQDAGEEQSASTIRGAVRLSGALHCGISHCVVRDCGTYGIDIGPGCTGIQIRDNQLNDLGAGGVTINGGGADSKLEQRVADIELSDNDLHALGRYYHSAAGILCRNATHCQILHNRIHDLYHIGISVGWVWGYKPSVSSNNVVEANDLYDIGQGMLSDMGGIYLLGPQPGTIVRGNRIHDVTSRGYGGWGIYLDEGSSDVVVEANLVYRTKNGGFHQHYGARNLIRNNIFAYGGEAQLMRTKEEDHLSFTLTANIIYWNTGPALVGAWKGHFTSDENCWGWSGAGPALFPGGSFVAWQAAGHDQNSLLTDPGFASPATGDFTLSSTSPALALGYHPVDFSHVGPRGQAP